MLILRYLHKFRKGACVVFRVCPEITPAFPKTGERQWWHLSIFPSIFEQVV